MIFLFWTPPRSLRSQCSIFSCKNLVSPKNFLLPCSEKNMSAPKKSSFKNLRRLILQKNEENISFCIKPGKSDAMMFIHQGVFDVTLTKNRVSLTSSDIHGIGNKLGALWSESVKEVILRDGRIPIVLEEGEKGNRVKISNCVI